MAAVSRISDTPASATTPSRMVRSATFSFSRQAAKGTTSAGAMVPVNSALAMRVSRTAVKKHMRLMPNSAPAGATVRQSRDVSRTPRSRRMACHTTEAIVRRQNATTEPGEPVSFTIVEPHDRGEQGHADGGDAGVAVLQARLHAVASSR